MIQEINEDNDPCYPFAWRVTLGAEHKFKKIGIIPDGAFAIEYRGQRAYYFLEYDRGTMPLKRKNLNETSFYRKLIAYYATWKYDLHKKKFGWSRFRVLTITSSEKRCQGLIDLTKQLNNGKGSGLFIYTSNNESDIPTLVPEFNLTNTRHVVG